MKWGGRGGVEFWELWGIGKQKRRDDDEGYDKGDKKKSNWNSLRSLLFIHCFTFDGQREDEDSLIYFSPPDSCLSHLFSIRTAPLLPLPPSDPNAPATSASPLCSSPSSQLFLHEFSLNSILISLWSSLWTVGHNYGCCFGELSCITS